MNRPVYFVLGYGDYLSLGDEYYTGQGWQPVRQGHLQVWGPQAPAGIPVRRRSASTTFEVIVPTIRTNRKITIHESINA
jgi:hypothetical protein